MEQADVPLAAERIEKLKKSARPFREFETAQALTSHIACVSADHVSHVKFGEFVIGEIRRLVALVQEFPLDEHCIFAAVDANADEHVCSLPVIQSVIEFGDDAPA